MSRRMEDALINTMKRNQPVKDKESSIQGWEINKTAKSSLMTSFYEARRNGFELKNLSQDELRFLFEYVSN